MCIRDRIGLRDVIDTTQIDEVLNVLKQDCTPMSPNWNRRYRNNLEKIKTGDIFEVADVVRNLAAREKEKGLSTGERKMLESAREILLSELIPVSYTHLASAQASEGFRGGCLYRYPVPGNRKGPCNVVFHVIHMQI